MTHFKFHLLERLKHTYCGAELLSHFHSAISLSSGEAAVKLLTFALLKQHFSRKKKKKWPMTLFIRRKYMTSAECYDGHAWFDRRSGVVGGWCLAWPEQQNNFLRNKSVNNGLTDYDHSWLDLDEHNAISYGHLLCLFISCYKHARRWKCVFFQKKITEMFTIGWPRDVPAVWRDAGCVFKKKKRKRRWQNAAAAVWWPMRHTFATVHLRSAGNQRREREEGHCSYWCWKWDLGCLELLNEIVAVVQCRMSDYGNLYS